MADAADTTKAGPYTGSYTGVHPDKIRTRMKEAHDLYTAALENGEGVEAGIYLIAREVAGLSLTNVFLAKMTRDHSDETGLLRVVLDSRLGDLVDIIDTTTAVRLEAISKIGNKDLGDE